MNISTSTTEPRSRTRTSGPATRATSPIRPTPYPQASRSTGSAFVSHHPHRLPLPPSAQSTWQQLVVHASSAAGTTAAVISEESMKCLKYCLSWLQYAIQHIEQQMSLLRNFLGSLASSQQLTQDRPNAKPSGGPSQLALIKRDIVNTLRKAVEVVSRYAATSLPHQGKVAVRGFILHLPSRWAALSDIRSTTTSPSSSPAIRPISSSSVHSEGEERTALRLLNFGQESVDMLQSVSVVFSDTVDRAELWLDRLRSVRNVATTAVPATPAEAYDNGAFPQPPSNQ
ncbi:transcription factor Opi1-domain-containing protein [Dichotomocladium elegans]|nr:transcription factor Opi1-domain-containing protein [Dichotomocladium elegans]